ncbi:hypothetical protein D9757_011461 [Collybiopsis confluens]|uniref:Aminoglycoside phosphotransferase domain-containing protein n=1 Tax=Collybiopsis confluens TaxID=2823264 RepID=A0A8H5LR06_9AGAR|nr:hypothetical protein D9757_011461 [Collybiopsis confluens]
MADSVNQNVLRERVETLLSDCCESLEEYIQGSHHLTYIAQMSRTGKKLVRIEAVYSQTSNRGGSGLAARNKMPSEIATMRFLKEHTAIPVPGIFGYDADVDGRVGGRFVVMEYIDGRSVDKVLWEALTSAQREKLALSLADLWANLMRKSFHRIGSLHQRADGEFYIGPMTFLPSNNFYAVSAPEEAKCGPFTSPKDWLEASARRDLAYKLSLSPPPEAPARIKAVLDHIRSSNELETSMLWDASHFSIEHVDFSTHNILVSRTDPTVILTVLDWEGARIVPMWAMNPAFRWPRNSNKNENKHLRALMRQRICSLVPGWEAAIGDECRQLRILCQKASLSDRNPEIILSDVLFMVDDM